MAIDGAYLQDAGWVFFTGWSLVVLAVSWIAFRADLPSLFVPSKQTDSKVKVR